MEFWNPNHRDRNNNTKTEVSVSGIRVHTLENLYSIVYLILELAHSPLKSIVNLDMMKEKFETRCLKNKYSYYFKYK